MIRIDILVVQCYTKNNENLGHPFDLHGECICKDKGTEGGNEEGPWNWNCCCNTSL